MTISSITTPLISSLGSSSSVLPIFVKDTINSTGISYIFSKKGGKHDGKERVIEEFGTQGIWLLGIPFVKKLVDWSVYKIAGVDPSVDIRKFKKGAADNIQDTIALLADTNPQKEILKKTLQKEKLAKGLFAGKWAFATAATLGALYALISYKQKNTQKEIKQEVFAQKILNSKVATAVKNFPKNQREKAQGLSFTGIKNVFSSFLYNPVMNMSILDGGITATRLKEARKGEHGEIAFRELSTIAFLYPLAPRIQSGLEVLAEKAFKKPVKLDYKVLASGDFARSLKDGSLAASLRSFKEKVTDDKGIVKFIYENPKSKLVEALALSGDVKYNEDGAIKRVASFVKNIFTHNTPALKDQTINALEYIDPKKVASTVENLEDMLLKSKELSADSFGKFIKDAKRIKAGTIFANIAVAVLCLGVIQPLLIIQGRKARFNGDSNNPAIRAQEEAMKLELA